MRGLLSIPGLLREGLRQLRILNTVLIFLAVWVVPRSDHPEMLDAIAEAAQER